MILAATLAPRIIWRPDRERSTEQTVYDLVAPLCRGRPEMSKFCDAVPVGRVVGLWRYPVKSMGAEVLSESHVSWNGLAGDRRWAFIRDNVVQSGFPWLTLRERGDMSQ